MRKTRLGSNEDHSIQKRACCRCISVYTLVNVKLMVNLCAFVSLAVPAYFELSTQFVAGTFVVRNVLYVKHIMKCDQATDRQ